MKKIAESSGMRRQCQRTAVVQLTVAAERGVIVFQSQLVPGLALHTVQV
jgi:hypothetical protein